VVVLLPYDGSAAARAALRRLAEPDHRRWAHGRLVLLLPPGRLSGGRCTVQRLRSEARRIAGDALTLSFWAPADDSVAALLERIAARPALTVVAPLGLQGGGPWYSRVTAELLSGAASCCVALHLESTGGPPLRASTFITHRPIPAGVPGRRARRRPRANRAPFRAQEVEP
jgi:hypothetical protein